MNVYDFDKTIYKDDSTADFVLYTFKKYPKTLLALPKIAYYGSLYVLRLIDKTVFKEKLYDYFKYLENIDKIIDEFVDEYYYKIQAWYFDKQKEDDLIISASPYFLVNAFRKKMNVKYLIASNVDKHTGKYDGLNCYGEEKVNRFHQAYPEGKINEFYSDSYSDTPLAKLADKAYLVTDGKLEEWDYAK